MQRDKRTGGRFGRWVVVAAAAATIAGALTGPAAGPASAATGELTVTGHGYGHGRGLGQWGALGYAVDRGWTAQQIVDHYYGGTVSGQIGNPGIGVELMGLGGRDLIVTAPGLAVDGAPVPGGSALVRRNGDGSFGVLQGQSCAGPWAPFTTAGSGLVVSSTATAADPANHVQVCETNQVRGYRGDFQVVNTGSTSAVVNRLLLEDYLRGVVPRESSAGWATLGGGRGAQALQAQAIAARSYAVSSPRSSYATTCDTTSCQVYGGEYTRPQNGSVRTSLDDARTDAAVAATSGIVRRSGSGAVVRTEFSASTGGWTAGGAFPAVEDLGDAYSGNPNRSWSTTFSWADLQSRLGVGTILGIRVGGRNGLGADQGRVTSVVIDTSRGTITKTGNEIRVALGLKSDWFSLSSLGRAEAEGFVRATYSDLLGRTPADGEVSTRADQLVQGYPRGALAQDLALSGERLGHLVDQTYADALNRLPSAQERANWVSWLQNRRSLPLLRSSIWGSSEASLVRGSNAAWLTGLYRGVLARDPSAGEIDSWSQTLQRSSRSAVASGIATSEEARWDRLDAYYLTMLGRSPDAGAASWIPSLATDGDFTVVVGIAQSPEYLARAAGR